MTPITSYVVGFAFSLGSHKVALIRKERPEWQKGKLNGIGGHIEPGESPSQAMTREFEEETGVKIPLRNWNLFVHMLFPSAEIYFFKTLVPLLIFENNIHTTTDEHIIKIDHRELGQAGVIPNLRWLVPLAAYTDDDYEPIVVSASVAKSITPG